jgi:hypothetical protein
VTATAACEAPALEPLRAGELEDWSVFSFGRQNPKISVDFAASDAARPSMVGSALKVRRSRRSLLRTRAATCCATGSATRS